MVMHAIYRLFSCAMEIEAEVIIDYLKMIKIEKNSIKNLHGLVNEQLGNRLYKFIENYDIYLSQDRMDLLVITGIGKVKSTLCISYLINLFNIREVINIGLCGSLSDEFKRGNILRVNKVHQHDFYLPEEISSQKDKGINIDISYKITSNETKADFKNVILCSGDQFIEDSDEKDLFVREYGAHIVDMEGYSIASCAKVFGINLRMYKIISDNADGFAVDDFSNAISKYNDSLKFLMTKI